MENKRLAQEIVEATGGKENISQGWHCITRLRFSVLDEAKVDVEKVKSLPGVLQAQFKSGQFQVILGDKVSEVFAEVEPLLDGSEKQLDKKSKKRVNVIEYAIDVISGIFTPILPAIVAGGLLKGVMALLVAMNLISETGSNYEILNFISDAPFHFLPFLLAFSSARRFKVDPSLGVMLAGIIMYPQIIQYANSGEVSTLHFLGIPIPMFSYASSVIPIILGVWLLSYVYKYLDKIIPKSLRIVFLPILSILITAPITLAFIAPLGMYAGRYLDTAFTAVYTAAGPLGGMLMGGLMPLIVITGMHYAFFPGAFASFEKYGHEIMLLPANLVANLAQAGATLGVLLKTKDKKMKQLSFSTMFPAIFGITEPTIYGVTLKLKKPFYAALIGGGVGGAIFGTLTVKTTAFTIPGIVSLPTYIVSGTNNFLYAVIGVVSAFTVAMVLTMIFGFEEPDHVMNGQAPEETNPVDKSENNAESIEVRKTDFHMEMPSPLKGKIVPLSEVPDPTFSQELLGKGVAIIPDEGVVYAPFSGKVVTTTPNQHAIGIKSKDGVELLIHIGLDTVSLEGKGFEMLIDEGEFFEAGDKLMTFNLDLLKAEEDISLVSPIIVTNTSDYMDVIPTNEEYIETANSKLLMLIK